MEMVKSSLRKGWTFNVHSCQPGDSRHVPIDTCAFKANEKNQGLLCSSDKGNTSFLQALEKMYEENLTVALWE